MDLTGIFHRCRIPECYARDRRTLVIRLETNKSITAVNLIHQDPYINGASVERPWFGVPAAMRIAGELERGYLWTAEVTPKFQRLQYYFELFSGDEQRLLFEDGLYTQEEAAVPGLMMAYFKYAFMNASDIYAPPEWVADTVWYQIMPDRFRRAGDAPEGGRFSDWNDTAHMRFSTLYGGNLPGITEKLPYLSDLGISGIYLTPIFESPSSHKYDTTDYRRIDPDFGTDQDFQELVEKAHSLGIRVMLDAVFNHCGYGFSPWQDVLRKGKASPYYDWFFVHGETLSGRQGTEDGRFYSFAFTPHMPKLNTNNPAVAEYLYGLCEKWVTQWDIDGIRFDVGNEISHTFIKKLRGELKALKGELFLLGEIWHDADPWLHGDEYDSVMNYPWMNCVHNFFVDRQRTAKAFQYEMNRVYSLYMDQVNQVLFNFLDSHDVDRAYSRCGEPDAFFQQLAILMTMPGTPCIYYGTEIAMDGKCGLSNRKPMPWEEIDAGKYAAVTAEVKALLNLRNTCPALKGTRIAWYDTAGRFLRYERPGAETVEVAVNADRQPFPLCLPGREILFVRGYENQTLLPGGVCVSLRKNGTPPEGAEAFL